MLHWRGLLISRNIDSWLVLDWKEKRVGHKPPSIDGKAGLTVTTVLQSRLIKETDILKHLA